MPSDVVEKLGEIEEVVRALEKDLFPHLKVANSPNTNSHLFRLKKMPSLPKNLKIASHKKSKQP